MLLVRRGGEGGERSKVFAFWEASEVLGVDVENSEAGVGEMRDVRTVDELPESLLVAVV